MLMSNFSLKVKCLQVRSVTMLVPHILKSSFFVHQCLGFAPDPTSVISYPTVLSTMKFNSKYVLSRLWWYNICICLQWFNLQKMLVWIRTYNRSDICDATCPFNTFKKSWVTLISWEIYATSSAYSTHHTYLDNMINF